MTRLQMVDDNVGTNDPDSITDEKLIALARDISSDISAFIALIPSRLPKGADADTQFLRHGYAWFATLGETLAALCGWADQLVSEGQFSRLERMILAAAFAEYLHQIGHGVAMSQDEVVRPLHFGLEEEAVELLSSDAAQVMALFGIGRIGRDIVEEAVKQNSCGAAGLDDTLTMIADQFHDFVDERVTPEAHGWHMRDELIPDALIAELAELGVFGLTIPEEHGGSGMGKLAMCVVTEELSRGYIGVGSLGTRSEIAGELIQLGGTDAQKAKYLPAIAAGEIYPAAVFTEPNTGSDLASLKTRATRTDDGWVLTGNKTWITHAGRSDLMTVLARTDPAEPGHRGLTMFLLDKQRGTAEDPFPDAAISGGEIEVLGYRGMKEYTVAFDGVTMPHDAALGEAEGHGFRQLMSTFEGARVQTAARAVGVAINAFELALDYSRDRMQFGEPLLRFQRVYGKLARMIIDITAARQLTYSAARAKDEGQRCDIEAGMAKLLGARAAWSCADNALQIHGGNGYATEYAISRVLCDARILNIFEGAAEIQAEVVARGLLTRRSNRVSS